MFEELTVLFNSLIAYVQGINIDGAKETFDMIVSNINFETIQNTFAALSSILASIGAIFGI